MSAQIAGYGAVTAVGRSALSSAIAVRAGVSMLEEHAFMLDRLGEAIVGGHASWLDPALFGPERLAALALPAACEALDTLDAELRDAANLSVHVGLPEPRPGLAAGWDRVFEERLHARLSERCRIDELSTHALGHCGGGAALADALASLETGASSLCLVGGVDSYLMPDTVEWLQDTERLHTDEQAFGFFPGEAAGFCLVASPEAAARWSLPARARVLSVGTAVEPVPPGGDEPCLGQGLSAAFLDALEGLPEGERVADLIGDMNGERHRADEFGFAALRCAAGFEPEAAFRAPADCWGDVGAASAPLFALLATHAAERGDAAGALTLAWTSSFGDTRSALLLETPHGEGDAPWV